jgi:hypothetical protein
MIAKSHDRILWKNWRILFHQSQANKQLIHSRLVLYIPAVPVFCPDQAQNNIKTIEQEAEEKEGLLPLLLMLLPN